jgi:succinate dehydrogenase/fumarate reductase flavoprotein subunit
VTVPVPQEILDALTRVDMPTVRRKADAGERVTIAGRQLPVHRCGVLVVGSGAAGLRAAVESQRAGLEVLVLSMSLYGGTSACSGSDKQTLHTAGTARNGDDFRKLAAALGAGGAMDGDTAYIEAVGSIGSLAGLQYLGLPLPTDRFGAVLRYQTDHDEVGRATSCGPRTSRLMVKVLAEEAARLGIPFLPKCEAVRLLTDGSGAQRRCVGVLAIDQERRDEHGGFCLVLAGAVILASGGPGELYRDSVYPRHCYGSLGMAIEAGVAVCNLTESQFGIGTRRQEFPWNLSGTYVQVIPHIYSVDAEGREHHFLANHYRTTRELACNIFRKGYQWPFHATRMENFGSSLVDLAIFRETQAGRTVLMDFNRDPLPGRDGKAFSLDDLDDDVRSYLANNGALQASPIERLRCMNPLAIELYRMHGHDLAAKPLPFALNNQHMNGGITVDLWNASSVPGCYAVGEVAGTHGVTRPGGAALNAGQVGGMRAARHLAVLRPAVPTAAPPAAVLADAGEAMAVAWQALDSGALTVASVRDEIQARMSDRAGCFVDCPAVPAALTAARTLRQRVLGGELGIQRPTQLVDIFRWRHLALLSEAVLTALDHYIAHGGGSRGARAYCAPDGEVVFATAAEGPLEQFRYRKERPEHRRSKLVLTWDGTAFSITDTPLRELEDLDRIFFEKNWAPYLTDAIHARGFRHG